MYGGILATQVMLRKKMFVHHCTALFGLLRLFILPLGSLYLERQDTAENPVWQFNF